MSIAAEPGVLWTLPTEVLSEGEAIAASEAVIEMFQYEKHFPFVRLRSEPTTFDQIGIWKPRFVGDTGTIRAHLDKHPWLQSFVTAAEAAERTRTEPVFDDNFAALLRLEAGQVFPPHQDSGRRHRRSSLALSGLAKIYLLNIQTGEEERFTHSPRSQYEMQVSDDELISIMHGVEVDPGSPRISIIR